MANKGSSIFLDVDDTSIINKMILPENNTNELESLIPQFEESKREVPWKWAQPTEGKCIKTHMLDGEKVFINICHTADIPNPHNLDEEAFLKIYSSTNDEIPDLGIRVPLSIGECHEELDKSGAPCKAFDVAVGSEFFQRAETSPPYMRFLTQVAVESVADKFKLELDIDRCTVLRNRKAMGKLQRHRIEQRAPKGALIQELPLPAQQTRPPESCRLARRAARDGAGCALLAELRLADVVSADEVSVRVGEDRLRVESARRGYLWDAFVPLLLDAAAARATFVRSCRVLSINIPISAA